MLQAIIAGFKGLEALGGAVQKIADAFERAQAQELADLRRAFSDTVAENAELKRRLAVYEAALPASNPGGGSAQL
jgi:hypothetical protein